MFSSVSSSLYVSSSTADASSAVVQTRKGVVVSRWDGGRLKHGSGIFEVLEVSKEQLNVVSCVLSVC